MINKSIIFKLFIQTILIFTVIFVIQFIFQSIIFPRVYISNKKNEISLKIDELLTELSADNSKSLLIDYSQITQTTTELIPINDIEDKIIQNSFYQITVRTLLLNDYILYAPEIYSDYYQIDSDLSGRIYQITNSTAFVPSALIIDNNRLIYDYEQSREILTLFDVQVNTERRYNISGVIVDVVPPDLSNVLDYSPIVTSEVLNIATNNLLDVTEFDNGYYYTSLNKDGNESNLVFLSPTTIDGIEYVILSVFSLQQVDDIAKSIQVISLYLFIFAFILLAVVSYFYSKNISSPIILISKKTKQMSNMNFTDELIELDREDELGDLADSIDILAINLKTALDTLKEQNNQLSQIIDREMKNESLRKSFVSGISHELKTPLAVIQASAEAVESGVFTSRDDIQEQLRIIQKEVSKTSKLIVDMVNVYNLDIENFKDSFVIFNLDDIIVNSVNTLNHLAESKKLQIEYNTSKSAVYGDKNKLEMVISNLLTNAIKYTPEHNKIIITTIDRGEYLEVNVINTGTFIPEIDIEKVFEPFYRIDKARSRVDGSTGIGLYLVSQILKQHNSKFSFTNIDNAVKFSFTLKKGPK